MGRLGSGKWRFLCSLPAIGAALFAITSGTAIAFDIEAHRGGRALFPENTLRAFANALSMGVDTLELDMGVTQDQVVVVSHERGLNPDLARAADGGYVAPPGITFWMSTPESAFRPICSARSGPMG